MLVTRTNGSLLVCRLTPFSKCQRVLCFPCLYPSSQLQKKYPTGPDNTLQVVLLPDHCPYSVCTQPNPNHHTQLSHHILVLIFCRGPSTHPEAISAVRLQSSNLTETSCSTRGHCGIRSLDFISGGDPVLNHRPFWPENQNGNRNVGTRHPSHQNKPKNQHPYLS